MYARVYMRVHCGQIAIRTQDQHTTGTRTAGKGEDPGKAGKPEYICMIAGDEKSIKKSQKKFGNMEKPPYLCSRN